MSIFKTLELLEKSQKEALTKSRKDDLDALGAHAEWASKTLQHNGQVHGPHLNWLANNVRKNPNAITPEVKTKIEHFASMYHLPKVRLAKLSGHTLESGIQELSSAEAKSIAEQKTSLVTKKGNQLTSNKSGRGWWNLGVAGCPEEGAAGKHCGNTPSLKIEGRGHERVISLRSDAHGDKMNQHLTAVLNDGYITELKGRANTKPKPEYHNEILDLLEHPSVKGFVGGGYAAHSNFEEEDIKDPIVRSRLDSILAKKPNLFTPDVSDLHESIRKDPFLSLSVTKKGTNKELSLEEQKAFLTGGLNKFGINFLSSGKIHPEIQKEFLNHPSDSIRVLIARNPNTDSGTLKHLANDESGLVRNRVATHPNSDSETLNRLAVDKETGVRLNLALNPEIDLGVQQKLLYDPDVSVIERLAGNPNLDQSLMPFLLKKDNLAIRENLASNPRIDDQSIKHLIGRLNEKDTSVSDARETVRLSMNPSVDKESQLLILKKHPQLSIFLASNPSIHPDVQRGIVNNKNFHESVVLSKNPSLDPSLQSDLFNLNHPDISKGLAKNPSLTPENQQLILEKNPGSATDLARNPNLDQRLYDYFANHKDKNVRNIFSMNPGAPDTFVDRHEKELMDFLINDAVNQDEAWNVAETISKIRENRLKKKLKDPNTDELVLRKYEHSHNESVSAAAKEGLKRKNPLKKSQYADLHLGVLGSGSSTFEPSNELEWEKLENEKLNPEQLNKLIQNNNPKVLAFLLLRKDLNLENLLSILNNEKEIQDVTEEQKNTIYDKVIKKIKEIGTDSDYVLSKMSSNGLVRLANSKFATPEALDKISVFGNLSIDQIKKLMNTKVFHPNHAINLIKGHNDDLKSYIAIKTILKNPLHSDGLIRHIFSSSDYSKVQNDILKNKNINIPKDLILTSSNHDDVEVAKSAHDRPEMLEIKLAKSLENIKYLVEELNKC